MSGKALADLIDRTGIDGHAFATWYVNHVERARKALSQPLGVVAAVQLFIATETI